MQTDLKSKIRNALAGSSSQKPVGTAALYKFGTRGQVIAALMGLYQSHEVCCCKIIKRGKESIVWWLSGAVSLPHSYCRATKKAST